MQTKSDEMAFENMLDISALNAFIVFTDLNPLWKYTQKKIRRRLFLIEVGKSLVLPHIENRKRLPRGRSAYDAASDFHFSLSRENSPSTASTGSVGSIDSIVSPTASLQNLTHTPTTKKRIRCHLCQYSLNATAHTARCDKCKRAVCSEHRFTVCSKCCGNNN